MTDCARLLEVLSDGKPHGHTELYGLGMIVHSRIADLRKRGHAIRSWRERRWDPVRKRAGFVHFYRLEDSSGPVAASGEQTPRTSLDSEPSVSTPKVVEGPGACVASPSTPPVQLELVPAERRQPSWA